MMIEKCPVSNLPITYNDDWFYQAQNGDYHLEVKCVGQSIIVISMQGYITSESITANQQLIEQVLNLANIESPYFLTVDLSKVDRITLRARRQFAHWLFDIAANLKLMVFWGDPTTLQSFTLLKQLLSPEFAKVHVVSAYKEAIQLIMQYQSSAFIADNKQKSIQDTDKVNSHIKDLTQHLAYIIWQGMPQQTIPKLPANNPLASLYTGVAVVQQELQAIEQGRITKANHARRRDKAISRINAILAELVDEATHNQARQKLLEIITGAAGYTYALLSEMEPDSNYMCSTAVYAPDEVISKTEEILGFSLLGFRFYNDPTSLSTESSINTFTRFSDYYTELPETVCKALDEVLNITNIVVLRQFIREEYLGTITFAATTDQTDLTLLEYLCNNHLVYALRLMREQVTHAKMRQRHVEELEQRVKERTSELANALAETRAAEEKLGELYLDLVRAREDAEERLNETETLLDGLRVLTESLSSKQTFSDMLDILRNPLGFENAFILTTVEDDALHVIAATHTIFESTTWKPESFFKRVLSGKPLAAFDIAQIPEWKAQSEELRSQLVAALHVPLRTGEQGAILIGTHSERGFFTKTHIKLAQRFSLLAAQALRNAELYAALKAERDALDSRVIQRTAELAEQRDFALQVMNTMGQGLSISDDKGQFTYVNPAYGNLLGYSADALTGKTLFDITFPEDHDILDHFLTTRLSGKVNAFEVRMQHAHDNLIYVLVTAVPRWRDNQIIGSIMVITDLTKQKHVEEALSAARDQAIQASRLKSEFLAAMSHELRTPLNAILGLSEALEEEIYGPLTESQTQPLQDIQASGRHLLSLINDILDISKIEAGHLNLEIAPIPIKMIIDSSLRFVKRAAQKKHIKVTSSIDSQVTIINADGRRLKQILVNLLSNAVKFTPDGGEVSLDVVGNMAQKTINLIVSDTGIGIHQEDMERLFQPFVQLDSKLSRQYEGTGLGLALVYHMVKMHNGEISVKSEINKGSHFTISFPWEQPSEQPIEEEINTEDDFVSETHSHKTKKNITPTNIQTPNNLVDAPTILLAEDNEANIKTLRTYLSRKGYEIIVAKNGIEAVNIAKEKKPDLVLMDIQMPKMNGLEATRLIRADTRLISIPIIALTALAMPGDRELCLAAGANGYMSKPVSFKHLVATIEKYLKERANSPLKK